MSLPTNRQLIEDPRLQPSQERYRSRGTDPRRGCASVRNRPHLVRGGGGTPIAAGQRPSGHTQRPPFSFSKMRTAQAVLPTPLTLGLTATKERLCSSVPKAQSVAPTSVEASIESAMSSCVSRVVLHGTPTAVRIKLHEGNPGMSAPVGIRSRNATSPAPYAESRSFERGSVATSHDIKSADRSGSGRTRFRLATWAAEQSTIVMAGVPDLSRAGRARSRSPRPDGRDTGSCGSSLADPIPR